MPVYSMTGYASVSGAGNANGAPSSQAPRFHLELRSVNGRFLDLSLKLPDSLRALEPGLRELVGSQLKRGKVELRLLQQDSSMADSLQPGSGQLLQLAHIQEQVRAVLPEARPLSVQEALQWCRLAHELEDAPSPATSLLADPAALLELAAHGVEELKRARAVEGARLQQVLLERLNHLRELASKAAPLIPSVLLRQQHRFITRWNEAVAAIMSSPQAEKTGAAPALLHNPATAQERALSEAAAHALRIDVAEELARLGSHLDEIERLLLQGGELGKRLDFLIQELHREANTLGSKSSSLELTALSVDMKVAIEQMREQVQNLE